MFRSALFLLAVASAQLLAQDLGNPKPAATDLVLPLPGNMGLAFRPVAIGDAKEKDQGSFTAHVYKIGDRAEGGFQEFPTDVSVGGAVTAELDGKLQWVFYLGKYEVSEAQWYAVMGGGTGTQGKSLLPVRSVSWFEVQDFLNKLNTHLFATAKDKLPTNQGSPCFVRLPTEAEWEFAARGGLKVSANDFDRKHPYTTGTINDYEWFSGPASANDTVKRIGGKKPNPLGLHDMLGNVAEFTSSQYSVEYYQGRVGGIVTRGGDFYTEPDRVRASARDEFPLYNVDDDFKPRRMETLGIRLALASPIFTNALASKKMAAEWESYRSQRAVPSIASPTAPNRAAQVAGRITGLNDRLQRLKAQLEQSGAGADLKDAVALALSDAQNLTADANSVEALLANTLVEAAFIHIGAWGDSLNRAKIADEQSKNPIFDAALREEDAHNAKMFLNVAQQKGTAYGETLRRMGTANVASVDSAIAQLKERFGKLSAGEQSQQKLELPLVQLIDAHVRLYRDNPRVDEAKYRDELIKLYDSPP